MSESLLEAARKSEIEGGDAPAVMLPDDQAPVEMAPIEEVGRRLRKREWEEYCKIEEARHKKEGRAGAFDRHRYLKSLAIPAPYERFRVSAPKFKTVEVNCVDESEAIQRFCSENGLSVEADSAVNIVVTNIEHTVPLPAPAKTK